ncbi:MAG: hydroxyacylglutathione hydrolase [Actinomycetota bacterium]|jgi:glyoxylase-like metal-dependent hydrolase (beta-lactamase superfamily II)/rhodanese-related sulfurtransferase
MHVDVVETPELGDRSYIVSDDGVAIVIDPQRDIDRVLDAAASRGARITHVLETHIHNDYVSGGLELARRTRATYVVGASEQLAFDHTPVSDGDLLVTGAMRVRVVATPGHTPGHLSYLVADGEGDVAAAFTGGSMLFGAVGRTDLVGPRDTRPLAHQQYRSVRRLAALLPDGADVHPTHGFGSFCAATAATSSASTAARQRRENPALRTDDEECFVTELLAGYTAFPSYYAHMAPLNRAGPPPLEWAPVPVAGASELARRCDAGEWVVDVRHRRVFAHRHLPGTVNVELINPFATYLGWVMPWGAPLSLVADTPADIDRARLALSRIGVDHVATVAVGSTSVWHAAGSYRVAGFADLATEPDAIVLDVRRRDEVAAGRLPGSIHIHLADLPGREAQVPVGEVWVHCASGFRAAIAASLMARAGRTVVLVDDDWERAEAAGCRVERLSAARR